MLASGRWIQREQHRSSMQRTIEGCWRRLGERRRLFLPILLPTSVGSVSSSTEFAAPLVVWRISLPSVSDTVAFSLARSHQGNDMPRERRTPSITLSVAQHQALSLFLAARRSWLWLSHCIDLVLDFAVRRDAVWTNRPYSSLFFTVIWSMNFRKYREKCSTVITDVIIRIP